MNTFILVPFYGLLAAGLGHLPVHGPVSQLTQVVFTSPSLNQPLFNVPPPPDNIQAPGRRASGAGSRSCGDVPLLSSTEHPLTALVPTAGGADQAIVYGTTATAHPTVWFYMPYQPPLTATFVLRSQDGSPVYETNVPLPDAPGVVPIALPRDRVSLEPDQPYRWFLKVYCQTPPPIAYVEGWIERSPLAPHLEQQLALLPPQEQARLYAAEGLWHDALTTAADLHQANAADSTWQALLQAVDLGDLAAEPLLPCCSTDE